LWTNQYSLDHKLEGTAFILVSWLGLSFSAYQAFISPIRVLANVVGSLREEDFSFRATRAIEGDALGELAIEINRLARALEEERLGTLEAASLLRKVMTEASAAIFAFSPDGRIHLLNRAAAALLGGPEERILHGNAREFGIEDLLSGPSSETITRSFGNMEKRWLLRRSWFRQHGIQHRLVVMSEASEALRAEERSAWQRLIRVLSHEINNSLAPIKSIARTLTRMPEIATLPPQAYTHLSHGLEVISSRAESLNRFLQNYAKLANLPPPDRHACDMGAVVQHVTSLDSQYPVTVREGPTVQVYLDSDQMKHVLINLVKNAAEAVLLKPQPYPLQDSVVVSWAVLGPDVKIFVRDQGVGLSGTDNLFVPFFTTKPDGSGIGLVFCRQVVERHGGQMTIRNRNDTEGCEVVVIIPDCVVAPPQSAGDACLETNRCQN
jgi:nitrogen fixation/metabolism regulation signal transduction histidine kinase